MTKEWIFSWEPAKGEKTPTVIVCPLKYGKRWAYAVEIDDGPSTTATVVQPLLEQFGYSDAPPGIPGGKKLPFVGTAAIMAIRTDADNDTFLSWAQIHGLESKGWAIASHSYWHSGYGWDSPKGELTPAQLRDELYWSQTIFASESAGKRSPSHFVYPNGYMAYKPYLKEFGLLSSSRVAGKPLNLLDPNADFEDVDRNYLDEGAWKPANDAMMGIPVDPKPGSLIIDFTHGIESDPKSANHLRWVDRLTKLAASHGLAGDDSLWSAPTPEILDYVRASRAAVVQVGRGRVSVKLPEAIPGSSITIKLSCVDPASKLTPPIGGSLYREKGDVWITTPMIGTAGVPPPKPLLKCVYRGPAQDITLPKPERIAGIRLLQAGESKSGFHLKIDLIAPDGRNQELLNTVPVANWGVWQLYPIVPNRPAVLAKSIKVAHDPAFHMMDIWALMD